MDQKRRGTLIAIEKESLTFLGFYSLQLRFILWCLVLTSSVSIIISSNYHFALYRQRYQQFKMDILELTPWSSAHHKSV